MLADCDEVVEGTYHVRAAQQAMMETFRTTCFMDAYGRLNIFKLYTDCISCKTYHFQCTWNSEIQDPCQQTENRRRIWCKAVGRGGIIPGICHMEDGKSFEDDFYKRGIADRIVSET